jgi:hypothetical protein
MLREGSPGAGGKSAQKGAAGHHAGYGNRILPGGSDASDTQVSGSPPLFGTQASARK